MSEDRGIRTAKVMTSLFSSACISSLNSTCNFLMERAFCVFFIRSSQFLVLSPAWRCERLGQSVRRGIHDKKADYTVGFFCSFHGLPETRPFDVDARINMIRKSHDHFKKN